VAGRNLGVMIKGEKLRKKLAVESSSWFLIMSVKDVVTEMIKKNPYFSQLRYLVQNDVRRGRTTPKVPPSPDLRDPNLGFPLKHVCRAGDS
jgi:hypothetical protein